MEFQTRSEETGLRFFSSLKDAMEAAEKDSTIWKISFSVGEERVRLVKANIQTRVGVRTSWELRQIDI